MTRARGQWIKVGLIGAVCLLGATTTASAQGAARGGNVVQLVPATSDGRSADEIRQDLRELFGKYPPSLAQVLRTDPTLLGSEAYLAPYPELRTFIAQHPEVVRSPDYFLSFVQTLNTQMQRSAAEEMWANLRSIFEMLAVGTIAVTIGLTLIWLIRHLLAHRRWLRATKIQMDLHNRLMERLSSSEDVRHYLESAATSRLLADVPPMLESGRAGSPVGRILLAVQAGVVLCCAGAGILLVKSLVAATGEAADTMIFFGVFGLALGLGFALSALASYAVSQRLGLLSRSSGSERA